MWDFELRSTRAQSSICLALTMFARRAIASDWQSTCQLRNGSASPFQLSSICFDPPRGQCTFYAQCLEVQYHCGEDGYPLGYGQKYCDKFNTVLQSSPEQFSSKAIKWTLDTMQCLQRALVTDVIQSQLADNVLCPYMDCHKVQEIAFESHAACYLDNGICSLQIWDWIEIVRIVGVGTVVGSWDALEETLKVAGGCLRLWKNNI